MMILYSSGIVVVATAVNDCDAFQVASEEVVEDERVGSYHHHQVTHLEFAGTDAYSAKSPEGAQRWYQTFVRTC